MKQAVRKACWFLVLLFNPENEGNMFLQNFGSLSADYTALYPRKYNSS
jgi:hypothetical protein